MTSTEFCNNVLQRLTSSNPLPFSVCADIDEQWVEHRPISLPDFNWNTGFETPLQEKVDMMAESVIAKSCSAIILAGRTHHGRIVLTEIIGKSGNYLKMFSNATDTLSLTKALVDNFYFLSCNIITSSEVNAALTLHQKDKMSILDIPKESYGLYTHLKHYGAMGSAEIFEDPYLPVPVVVFFSFPLSEIKIRYDYRLEGNNVIFKVGVSYPTYGRVEFLQLPNVILSFT